MEELVAASVGKYNIKIGHIKPVDTSQITTVKR